MLLLFGFFSYILIASWYIYKAPLIYQKRNYKRDQFYIAITLGILLLMACLRSISVGNDTNSYYLIFRYYGGLASSTEMSLAGILWLDNMEIAFRALNFIVHRITDNYQIFLSVIACFSYLPIIKFIKKYSQNISLSCVIFFLIFYGTYTNLFRQVLAISIILFAFDWLNREKYIQFGAAVSFVAVLFHRTAIIALLLCPMAMLKRRKLMLLILFVIVFAIVALGKVPVIINVLGIKSHYTSQLSGISIVFSAIMNMAFFTAFLFLKQGKWDTAHKEDSLTKLNPKVAKNLINWIPYICLLFSVVAFAVPIATRFELYFKIFYLILFPEILQRSTVSDSKKGIIINILIFTLLVYIFGIIIYRPEWVTEYNYKFYWQD